MSSDFNDSVRTLFKSGGVLLLGVVLQLFLSFLAKLFIARELSLADFGSIALGLTIATFGGVFASLGLHNALGRYLPRFETPEDRRGVLVTAYSLAVPLAAVSALALALASPVITRYLFDTPSAVAVLQVFSLVLFFSIIERLAISTAQGLKKSTPKVLLENFANPVSRFVAVGAVLAIGVTPVRFAWAYVVGRMVPALLGLVFIYRETPLFEFSIPFETRYREMLEFSLPLVLTSAIILVYGDIDTLMLGYFRTSAEVGVYNVVYSLGNLLTTGLLAFSFVFMPMLSEYHAEGNETDLRRMYQIALKWVAVVTVPVFLLLFLFPGTIISATFGPKYSGGALALRAVAAGFCIHALAGLNSQTLTSFGKTKVILVANLAAGVTNVGLNLVLIPQYGGLGAGVATTITYLVLNVSLSGYLYWSEGIPPVTRNAFRPILVASVLAGLLFVTIRAYLPASLGALVLFVGVFSVLYGIVLLRYGAVENEEVMLIKSTEERFGIDLSPFKRVGHVFFREPNPEDRDEGDRG